VTAIVHYVHRISPKDTDREGPFPINGTDLFSVETALAWLKRVTGDKPRKKLARRTDTGWVFFPPDRCGNWHSISIVVQP